MSAAVGRRPAWVRQDGDMAEQDDARVGVYIDFDNIVISRADQARDEGFADATVDLDAIIDFASSYGRVTISRASTDEYRDYDSLIIAEKQLIAAVAESEPKAEPEKRAKTGPVSNAQSSAGDAQKSAVVGKSRATQLLIRATRFISEKKNTDWVALSEVKNQMLRLEPQFQESELGFDQFSKFVASRHSLIELNENRVRLRPSAAKVAAG